MIATAQEDRREHLLSAAKEWREQQAHFEEKVRNEAGNPAAKAMARVCADTATSLEMEAEDGVARCVCDMKPFGSQRDQLPYWKR